MADIISLADYRRRKNELEEQSAIDPKQAPTLLLLRELSRRLGLMPYDQWVAAGRPEGK